LTNILDGLLGRIDDPALRDALTAEVERLRDTKDFGLVFERHLPENVRLYSHPVRRGCKVQDRATDDETTWLVRRVTNGDAVLVGPDGEETTRPVEELVVIRHFGEHIHPGFKRVGPVERGGDKPFHTVINGENYHALETLLYTCEGQVDCIYIDPPYNTGAKDWKYDNDYVDREDAYRHSKWLAFMERRLKLAKRLLNPEKSVLIVTIDEKEVHRLALLLAQLFPNQDIQTVTAVTNSAGSLRTGRFTRVEEYIFFVFIGAAVVSKWTTRMLPGADEGEAGPKNKMPTVWFTAIRQGTGAALRANRTTPVLFYPVHIHEDDGRFHSVGEPLPAGESIKDYQPPKGTVALWPLHTDGTEQTWRFSGPNMAKRLNDGTARLGHWNSETSSRPITYLRPGTLEKIKKGEFVVTGRDAEGALVLGLADEGNAGAVPPAAVWRMRSHFARDYGTGTLKALLKGRAFPFPKSLYAVEDTLRVAIGDNPDALVLDFFGGSGTTAHAVARLNRQDGGRRRSIVVTNNEVSDDEAKALRVAGHQPGDPEWEALGIFQYVTKPRVTAAFTGLTPDGAPIEGDYKFTDEFPMADGFEENVEFLELAYLDRNDVSRGKAFEAIAPLLWMKVGAAGEMIARVKQPYAAPEGARYAVLFDVAHWQDFAEAVRDREDITHLFVVTDSVAQYQQVVAELPATVEVAMLYDDYLRNFEINLGGAS
jgi:adenine-specific DNA-methyltransferase